MDGADADPVWWWGREGGESWSRSCCCTAFLVLVAWRWLVAEVLVASCLFWSRRLFRDVLDSSDVLATTMTRFNPTDVELLVLLPPTRWYLIVPTLLLFRDGGTCLKYVARLFDVRPRLVSVGRLCYLERYGYCFAIFSVVGSPPTCNVERCFLRCITCDNKLA